MAKEFNIFEVPFEGISLIEAGAGTGKTYNIAGLFVRAIIEKQLLPANILVLTYTEAATAELKQRLREKLLNSIKTLEGANTDDAFLLELKSRCNSEVIPQLKRALYAFDEATISTIHGFCHRLLKEYSLEFGVNPGFEILPDEGELLQEVVDEYWREIFAPTEDEFQSALQHFFAAKGIYPEKLLNQIKPALDNPYAKRVPEIKSIHKFTDELGELKKAAVILKKTFSQNYSDLKLIVEGDALNGSLYRNKETLLDEISKWIKESEVPDIPPEKLIRFGKFLPERGVKKNKTVPRLELYDAIDNYLEKHQAFSNVEVALYREAITRVNTNFAEKKDRLGVLGYNDLLTKVLDGIRSKSELAADIERRFPVGLIDEFQDTDIVQYAIFRAVYGNPLKSSLFLIGDPKQAIYRFRGADLNTYLKAKSEINDENIYTLSTNYRSEKSLIEAVNAFFKYKEEPFIKSNLDFIEARFPTSKEPREADLAQTGKVVPSVQLISFDSKKAADQLRLEIAESIATEIVELLGSHIKTGEKRLTKKDIAVLTNTHFQASQIQETLKNRGLKSIIKSKESVFNTSEADELYRVLKAINNPENEPGIRAALGTELLGYRASEIRAFLDDPAKWTELTDQFFALNVLWLKNGFSAFSDALIKEMNLEKRLVSLPDSERRWTNFYHIIELLQKAYLQSNLSMNGLLRFFRKKMGSKKSVVAEEDVIRLESDAELIQIVTIHASKGLEFPVVFCPFLWESRVKTESGSFNFSKKGELLVDIGTKQDERAEHLALMNQDQLEESIRLAYVALTRAKNLCIVYLDNSWKQHSPLKHLIHGNERFTQHIEQNEVSIQEKDISYSNTTFFDRKDEPVSVLRVKKFKRNDLLLYPRLTSFSSLSASTGSEFIPDDYGFDYDDLYVDNQTATDLKRNNFSLPKGKKTGTLLHSIFEEIDFQRPGDYPSVIASKLEIHGFNQDWNPIVLKMVRDVLSHPLAGELSMDKIPSNKRLIEMEFHFPVRDINNSELISLIRGENSTSGTLTYGYMKGFIDLVFEWEGKYYLLDYKSNHLGDTFLDYGPESLRKEIQHAQYDLQYHIYTLALYRYLKHKNPGFDYKTQFGGVFYLFVRGVKTDTQYSGVYFDRPDLEIMQKLDRYMNGIKER